VLIQLKKNSIKHKTIINYFTKEILKSPYNKLPTKPKNIAILEYDNDSFFALSWLIKELGELKDIGLKIEHLSDAIFISENLSTTEAKQKAISILGFKQTVETDILKQASDVVKTALSKDKILDKLII
jgi:predicted nucleic acid-binding protein